MTLLALIRVLALFFVAALAATSCSASETVIVSDATIASATATAQRSVPDSTTPPAATSTPEAAATPDDRAANDGAASSTTGRSGCSYAGVDSFGDMQIELIFTSALNEQSDATVGYEVLDGSGRVLVSSTHFMEDLRPGEQVRMMVDTVTDGPTGGAAATGITCNVLEIEPLLFGFETFAPQPGDRCTFTEVDSVGDIQIQIDVVSPLDVTGELAIDYALRGPDGVRFEDSVTFTESVGAGQVSSSAVDTFTEFPAWVDQASFTCEVLSIQDF